MKYSENTKIKLRGFPFDSEKIKLINKIIITYYDRGITYISKVICEKLNWVQANGWTKDRACREALRELEKLNLVAKLPPKKKRQKKPNNLRSLIKRGCKYSKVLDKSKLIEINFGELKFKQVKGTSEEDFWNWLVNKYHYLGFKVFVGRSLKYLIYYQGRVISAMGFCDPVWAITPRDKILKNYSKDEIRNKGINNGRFLILPWIKVPNLASFLLSASLKKLYIDWISYYSVKPEYIETFVNSKKYKGTCYKAANWIYIGKTRGYKKSGKIYMNSQPSKAMYIYFFNKKLKKEFNNGNFD